MKQILLHNWKIKLTSLVLALLVWYVIQHNVNPSGESARRPFPVERLKK
jgi:YbbR domain-containing protein